MMTIANDADGTHHPYVIDRVEMFAATIQPELDKATDDACHRVSKS
ncbi:hypothetical protein JQ580_17060 [Bradyrhizobium japonicum]|jgi:hypothetical protein|nr:hypothetical protein [Bradyrhizobium japonicum]MBR0992424.1 hypothetical protein [Bradyrhizobium japonicum]